MAVIDTPPETVAAAAGTGTSARPEPTGFAAVLGSGDHKVIGRLYIGTSLVFAALLLILGLVFGIERLTPESLDVFGDGDVLAWWALGRLGLVFLVALPLTIGVATAVVPLQIGSPSIAFPRAAAAAYWGWVGGAVLLILSVLVGGGPGGDSDTGVRLYIAALGLIIAAVLLAAITLATTVLTYRQSGMSTDTVPMFSLSVLVASIVWLLTLPVALAQIGLAYVDVRHGSGSLVGAGSGLFDLVGWLLRNPQIYVVAIPVLGFVADVIATTAKVRIAPRAAASGAICAFGIFGIGAFLADAGPNDHKAWVVVALGLVAVLPVLAVLGLVGDLTRRGTFSLNGGALYGVAALLILTLTVLAGAAIAVPALELHGTVAELAVTHGAVLAALTAALGGVHWWATKIGRQPAAEGPGRLAPLLLLVGAVALIAADIISGLTGDEGGLELSPSWAGGVSGLNILVVAGFALALLGLLAAVASFKPLATDADGEVAADPWGGQTLEWLAPSPPPLHNFVEDLPTVTSAEPLTDLREEK